MGTLSYRHRPLGVIFLSLSAFVSAGVLIFMFTVVAVPIFQSLWEGRGIGNGELPYERFSIPLGLLCELILSWLAVISAIDLWKLRSRGRGLALTAMSSLLPVSSLMGVATYTSRILGTVRHVCFGISLFCVLSIVYLSLPRIRTIFE
jgi:hypothetical protein